MTEIVAPKRIGQTQVTYRPARDILTKTSGFIKTYDFTLNPYSGCSFGCSYCYAAFFSRDPVQQDNWGLWVNAKQNAARLLDDLKPGELDGKRIYMSSVTDPYQPLEQKIELTQQVLKKLARHRPKLVVQTRSPLVTRDIPLFQEIEKKGGRVQVNMTVTTDDEDVRKTFEPGCPSNPARLKAGAGRGNRPVALPMRRLARKGRGHPAPGRRTGVGATAADRHGPLGDSRPLVEGAGTGTGGERPGRRRRPAILIREHPWAGQKQPAPPPEQGGMKHGSPRQQRGEIPPASPHAQLLDPHDPGRKKTEGPGVARTAPKGCGQRLETKQRPSPHGRQSFPQNTGDIMWMAKGIPSREMPLCIHPLM